MLESRALRSIFVFKKEELRGEWRRLRKEKLHVFHFSPNIIRVIKLRGMRWQGMWQVWEKGKIHTGLGGPGKETTW
jgi:hypothetical protein